MTVTAVRKDPERLTMTLDAEFDATPERVWQLWADPRQLELMAILPWLTRDMCVEINKKLSVPLDNGNPPKLIGSAWASGSEEFTGSFGSGETIIDAGNLLFTRPEACFEGKGNPPAGSYHYYRAILPR